MDFLALLNNSFTSFNEERVLDGRSVTSRLEWLGEYIFGFTTYEDEMAELFARKAVEVCLAINVGRTFDYISTSDGRQWYLIMVNMPFFVDRLDWGTSIRGAWWNHEDFTYTSHALLDGDVQLGEMKMTRAEWLVFIDAIIEFSKLTDPQPNET